MKHLTELLRIFNLQYVLQRWGRERDYVCWGKEAIYSLKMLIFFSLGRLKNCDLFSLSCTVFVQEQYETIIDLIFWPKMLHFKNYYCKNNFNIGNMF